MTHEEVIAVKAKNKQRKALCVSCYYPLFVFSINYYVVYSLQIRKICALCGVFSAISVLLTTGNSDDLEIRVPDGSRSLQVTPTCVISY